MKTVIFAKCFVNVAEKNAPSIITQSFCLIAKLPGTHTLTQTHIVNCDLISLLNWKFRNDTNKNPKKQFECERKCICVCVCGRYCDAKLGDSFNSNIMVYGSPMFNCAWQSIVRYCLFRFSIALKIRSE